MSEKDVKHFIDSVVYAMEKTSIYCRVRGAQFFNRLNLDITFDQFVALDAVSFNENICQRDLAKLILKDRSNTGRILNILEEKGFVERFVETKAKRLVRKIYITEKGSKIIEDIQGKLREAFSNIFSDITEEEFNVLRKTLEKMQSSLSKETTIQI